MIVGINNNEMVIIVDNHLWFKIAMMDFYHFDNFYWNFDLFHDKIRIEFHNKTDFKNFMYYYDHVPVRFDVNSKLNRTKSNDKIIEKAINWFDDYYKNQVNSKFDKILFI